ncbi:hypothetical protein F4777DRAFT_571434 [Nemania sp. FL0916]|nr:hypothetical protein F4777DRAFT_571434 [Nemania sp. FL0916]
MPPPTRPTPSPFGRFKHELVAFFHPAYPDQTPPLLTLACTNLTPEGGYGIDFDMAKTACGIVACNRWDGLTYFAEKSKKSETSMQPMKPGEQQQRRLDHPGSSPAPVTTATCWTKIRRPHDGLLRGGTDYYFVVEAPEYRYPVVAGFDHWRFPHDALPLAWPRLSAALLLGSHDPLAHTSDTPCFEDTGLALVAPFSYKRWYDSNEMERYCHLHGNFAGEMDIPRLQDAIQSFFGDSLLSAVSSTRLKGRRLQLHPLLILQSIFFRRGQDQRSQYHDHQAGRLSPADMSCEHLFARFALNILSERNYKFLTGDQKYTVRLFNARNGQEYTTELHSEAIMQQSHIFRPANCAKSVSTGECDIAMDGGLGEESGYSGYESSSESDGEYHYTARGRARVRSPAYYQYRHAQRMSDQQGYQPAQYRSPTPQIPRQQHGTSISTMSLASTLSMSSLETPRTNPASEMEIDRDDASNGLPISQSGLKRAHDEEDHTADQLRKRSRLI